MQYYSNKFGMCGERASPRTIDRVAMHGMVSLVSSLTYFLYVVVHGLDVTCSYFVQVGEALGEVRNILAYTKKKRKEKKSGIE